MPAELPDRPNLQQLKKLSKDLLRAHCDGESSALTRVEGALPRIRDRSLTLRLSQAQAVVAREHGFASWPRLVAHVEAALAKPVTPEAASRPLRTRPASEIAEVFVDLAERLEIEQLAASLALGRRKTLAVREVLIETARLRVLVDALLLGARHHSPKVRYVCAHAMDIFADERCASALVELLGDPVPRVRRIAVHSVSCDECKIVPLQPVTPSARSKRPRDLVATIVELATNDPSIQVRRHAAVALSAFPDARATWALETLLTKEKDAALRRNALTALRRVRGPETEAARSQDRLT